MILVDQIRIEHNHFPDGTLHISVESNPRSMHKIIWKYESDDELFALICIVKHLRSIYEDCKIALVLPYVPHARMDRVKKKSDVFTLKYFAEVINDLKFSYVRVLDPHSHVSDALIDRIEYIDVSEFIKVAVEQTNPHLLFYPDEGAMKRYSSMIPMPYAFGIKRRNWETGKIEGLDVVGDVDAIANKNILIIDDICSRGGTFSIAAKKLKELGANKIYLYVSHCENTIHEGSVLDSGLVDRVYTTNSILTKRHPMIEVIGHV